MRPSTILTGLAAALGLLYLVSKGTGKVNGCIPDWQCEQPLNGYEKDGCGNRRLNTTCNPITPCTPSWVCEQPLNGYEKDGCGNRRLNTTCNPITPCTPSWVCETPLNGYELDRCGNRRLNTACNLPLGCSPLSCNLAVGGAGSSVQPGSDVKFDMFVVGGSGTPPYNYKLYIDNELIINVVGAYTQVSHTHTFAESGGYSIKLEVTDSCLVPQICTKTAGVTVIGIRCQIDDGMNITDEFTTPQGGIATIYITVKEPITSNMGIFTYDFYRDESLISSYKSNRWRGMVYVYAKETPGSVFQVKCKVTNDKGQSCTKIANITVTEPSPIVCYIQSIKNPVNQGDAWHLMVAGYYAVLPFEYYIYKGDVHITNLVSAGLSESDLAFKMYQFNEPRGIQTYTVEIYDSIGRRCSASTEVTIL